MTEKDLGFYSAYDEQRQMDEYDLKKKGKKE